MKRMTTYITVILVLVGVLAAGHLAYWDRYQLEKEYKQTELMMDYSDVKNIATLSGKTEGVALQELKKHGLTTVLFKEPTIENLQEYGDVSVYSGQDLLDLASGAGEATWLQKLQMKSQIQPEHTYLMFKEKSVYQSVAAQLQVKTKGLKKYDQLLGGYVLETPLSEKMLGDNGLKLGLGFSTDKLKTVQQAELETVVQVRNWPVVTDASLETVFGPIKKISNLSGVMFNDETIPGYSQSMPQVAKEIKETSAKAVISVEFFPQKGMSSLGRLLDKQVVRLHTIAPQEMSKYTPPRALDRYLLAATERNHRLLLVRTFSNTEGQDALTFYDGFLDKMQQGLNDAGLQVGQASRFAANPVSRSVMFLVGLGVIGGLMLILPLVGLSRYRLLLGGLALVAWGGLLWWQPVLARKLMALAAVLIFPSYSVMTFLHAEGTSPARAVVRFLAMSLISLIGSLLAVGLLADVGFMLLLDQFSGVKAAYLLPLVFLCGYFVYWSRGDKDWQTWAKDLFQQPVTVGLAVVAGLLLVAIAIYILRTGNDGAAVASQLELKFRSLLDKGLGVRPRTKEFLLGHPMMLFLIYFGYRSNRLFPLLVFAVIGQISMVNTFDHLHTPLMISIIRSFNGMWLGLILGLLVIVTYQWVLKWGRRRFSHG